MLLIVYYVVFMIAGDLSDYLIGLIVEREFGSHFIFYSCGSLGRTPFFLQRWARLKFCSSV